MSENLPAIPDSDVPLPGPSRPGPEPAFQHEWADYGDATQGGGGLSLERILLAIRRYWWLVAIGGVVGGVGGALAYRMTAPVYTAGASIMVSTPTRDQLNQGAVQAGALMEEASLLDLLRAPLVTERVVMGQRLYLQSSRVDSALFRDFSLKDRFQPGRYVLEISGTEGAWRLGTQEGVDVDAGVLGDSIGAAVGFQWTVDPELDARGDFSFTVIPPREAAQRLADRLEASLNRQGNFITVTLDDRNPERAAAILNGLIRAFEQTADSLKEAGLAQSLSDVEAQAQEVQESLRSAREQLQQYQMQIITRPSDRGAPVGPGLAETRAPIVARFEALGTEKEDVDQDRERLNRILAAIPDSGVPITQLELIPAAAQSSELQTLLQDLVAKRAERRELAQFGTDDYPPLVRLDQAIRVLEYEEVPRLVRSVVGTLERRSRDLEMRRDSLRIEMTAIPQRMSREDALRQEVADQEALATEVGRRRELQRLIFRSSLEDFQILNEATVPFTPSSDPRLPLAAAVFLGFLGTGLAGAVLLDRLDGRFRYPEDLTHAAGVEILGMIPRIRGKQTQGEVEEAFRDLRMRLMYAHGTAGPLMVAITSPGPNEGKTLVSANLGLAFAKIGRRTLLIDGDTRRGDLHRLIGGERSPGLVDFLAGTSDGRVIHRTEYPHLHFMGSGARLARAPELLAGERIKELFRRIRERYDVIILDAPPLAVGADSFHLASLAGSMALVVRAGASEKGIVEKKLQALTSLPFRILGGVLNDVASSALKGYGYYSYYVPGYEAGEEREGEEVKALPPGEASEVQIPD